MIGSVVFSLEINIFYVINSDKIIKYSAKNNEYII